MKSHELIAILSSIACSTFGQVISTQPYSYGAGASAAGRYSSAGNHSSATANYLTGQFGGETYAGFGVFNLPNFVDLAAPQSSTATLSSIRTIPAGSWTRRADLDLSPLDASPTGGPYAWQWSQPQYQKTVTQYTSRSALENAVFSLVLSSPGVKTSVGDSLVVRLVSASAAAVRATQTGRTDIYSALTTGSVIGTATPLVGAYSIVLDGGPFGSYAGGSVVLGLTLEGADAGEYVFGSTGSPVGMTFAVSGERIVSVYDPEETVVVTEPNYYKVGPSYLLQSPSGKYDLWYGTDGVNPPGFEPVPEPSRIGLWIGGLAGAWAFYRRRAAKARG